MKTLFSILILAIMLVVATTAAVAEEKKQNITFFTRPLSTYVSDPNEILDTDGIVLIEGEIWRKMVPPKQNDWMLNHNLVNRSTKIRTCSIIVQFNTVQIKAVEKSMSTGGRINFTNLEWDEAVVPKQNVTLAAPALRTLRKNVSVTWASLKK